MKIPSATTRAVGCYASSMPRPSNIRAVVFDLGNTLWFEARRPDPATLWRLQAEAVRPLLDAWRIEITWDLEILSESIWRAYETACDIEQERGTYRDPSLSYIIRGALADRGVVLDQAQADAWWRAAWIPVRNFGFQLYPDVLDVLAELLCMGVRIGVNTNRPCTAEMLWPDLHDLGIGRFIGAAVCSGDTGFVKPHSSTFDLISERLDIPLRDIVMVGDLCQNDCAGGRAVGMTTVLKLNGRHDIRPCPDVDFEIHDLSELLKLPLFQTTRARESEESLTPHEDENADRY